MKTLVVYDSVHGNTETIAKAIGDAIAGEVEVVHAGELSPSRLGGLDLLIVGSPTHGGRPTSAVRQLLDKVGRHDLQHTKVAAFDTRLPARWLRLFGYAAPRIAGSLRRKGGTLVGSLEGFFVEGGEGPLREGEVQRAAEWAIQVVESMN
jgi:flavodoxin